MEHYQRYGIILLYMVLPIPKAGYMKVKGKTDWKHFYLSSFRAKEISKITLKLCLFNKR